MRRSASCVVVTPQRRVLGITRGLNAADRVIPGGGVDPADPTTAHTAARELREETGVVVRPEDLRLVLETERHASYVLHGPAQWPWRLESRPFEGWVGLWHPSAFLAPTCSYREHTRAVFGRLGLT